MVFLTEPIEENTLENFKYRFEFLDLYEKQKILFTDKQVIEFLVVELQNCLEVDKERRSDMQKDIIELIIYLFRNSLSFSRFLESNES